MSAPALSLTYLGTFWAASGDLFYMDHPDGNEARVSVDSLGETWVDIRRVPEGGYFHTERVEAFRAENGAAAVKVYLRMQGYTTMRIAHGAHRVRERDAA